VIFLLVQIARTPTLPVSLVHDVNRVALYIRAVPIRKGLYSRMVGFVMTVICKNV
jgi:hypothetical protein